MTWNWQRENWPEFTYQTTEIIPLENRFLQQSGVFLGAYKHIDDEEQKNLIVHIISEEAVKTSEIEGEFLSRDSIQSSIRRHFGLQEARTNVPPAEQGIADMMTDLFENFARPLDHKTLFTWHEMLMHGRRDLKEIGAYRKHSEPMQVVSGYSHKPKVHFEAPPSSEMQAEMSAFISWFNETAPDGKFPLPVLTRAAITHLYFVCIHPFEDGNGRIARALTEKALAQSIGQPSLIALSHTIEADKKAYYAALEASNKELEITGWLNYLAVEILKAQQNAEELLEFVIAKSKFIDRFEDQLNDRQMKAILRIFQEGPNGFTGGLSAKNYITITGASRATATRDLQDLLDKKAFTKTGQLKGTRYWLNI